MLICKNFVHYNNFYLTGLRLIAGETSGAGAIPAELDELLIIRRFLKVIPNFMPPSVHPGRPDWVYEVFNITIASSNGNVSKQIKMLCTGDCNGSYIPY
jgi:hypothetical protein